MAAQYQSLVEQIQWLEALATDAFRSKSPVADGDVELSHGPPGGRGRSGRCRGRLHRGQVPLAGLAGLETEDIPPATGFRSLRRPAAAGELRRRDRSWPQRRLEATIPRREQAIIDQAAVVVEADAARAAATADFLAGRSSVERVLAGIEVQARETSAFLRAVTEYNRALSQYAIATLPANTEAEKLVAAVDGLRV